MQRTDASVGAPRNPLPRQEQEFEHPVSTKTIKVDVRLGDGHEPRPGLDNGHVKLDRVIRLGCPAELPVLADWRDSSIGYLTRRDYCAARASDE
jgi:hypothetical protein